MQLTTREKDELRKRWRDDRDLLYDRVLQPGQTVAADIWLLIPRGRRCLLWFTYVRGGPGCIAVDVDWKNNPTDFHIVLASFHRDLAFETLMGGVMIDNPGGQPAFCCTYVHAYKGRWLSRNLDLQIEMTHHIIHDMVRQDARLPLLRVCVPFAVFHESELESAINKSPAAIHGIRMVSSERNQILGVMKQSIEQQVRCVMLVKPEVEEDVYSLWSDKQVGHALVPDYKTSIMLNSLFRNVKENVDLDLLEESDDEEEFENVDTDRYLRVKEGMTMSMQFMPRFNGWRPCEIVSQPPTVSTEVERLQSMFRETRRPDARGARPPSRGGHRPEGRGHPGGCRPGGQRPGGQRTGGHGPGGQRPGHRPGGQAPGQRTWLGMQ
jgi:hypothetical protein